MIVQHQANIMIVVHVAIEADRRQSTAIFLDEMNKVLVKMTNTFIV